GSSWSVDPGPPRIITSTGLYIVWVRPPSTTNSAPVTADASGDVTKQMQLAISSGVRKRPRGVAAAVASAIAAGTPSPNAEIWLAMPSDPSHMGVAVKPGETVTTRMPWPAYSTATDLPKLSSAAFEAL